MNNDCEYHLETMNLELTTKCVLSCPQCYCSLSGGKDLPLPEAVYWIQEAAAMGVKEVMLSGGETLCYPYLYDVIKAAKEYCGSVNVALSGVGFDQNIFDKLLKAGVTGIYISLNGSTEEINSLSRDGYWYAINALELLRNNRYENATINWVMHSSNADDFANIIEIAEKYEIHNITILGLKPDSNHMLETYPTKEQMVRLKNTIRSYSGKCCIQIESCFSPMLALFNDTKLFGNFNVSEYKGCCAGRTTVSVSVDGLLSPCRHLDYYEKYMSVKEYMGYSNIQTKIRSLQNIRSGPCNLCRLKEYCRPCLAINAKMKNELFFGFEQCPIFDSV